MRLLAAFGDRRYAYMAAKARDEGIEAWTIGHEDSDVPGAPAIDPARLAHVDAVVMPNPFEKGLTQPFADPRWMLDAFLGALCPGTALLLFGDGAVPESVAERHPAVNLGQDEALVQENAVLTAEGAICSAMQKASCAIRRSNCLIIGFGRIGYALNELLIGLGARTTVAARREAVRRKAQQRGAAAVDMQEMERVLGAQRFVFSTPPEMVLAEPQIRLIGPNALVIDLSSPPYGVDLGAAKRCGVEAWLEPGLPGRYCPESAGEALLRAVLAAQKDRAAGGMMAPS